MLKQRAAKVFFLVFGTSNWGCVSEAALVTLANDFLCSVLDRVEGAWLCRHLKTIHAILKSMRSIMGASEVP